MAKEKNTGSFERLGKDKQEKIIHAMIDEFAKCGYDLASTNAVAKNAGIAKGSLFKYFGTKEHMFFHIAEHIFGHMAEYIIKHSKVMPADLVQRLKYWQGLIFDFAEVEPKMYRFFMRLSTGMGANAFGEAKKQLEKQALPLYVLFLKGLNLKGMAFNPFELMWIINMVDRTVDVELLAIQADQLDPKKVRRLLDKKMNIIYKLLEGGIYKKGHGR